MDGHKMFSVFFLLYHTVRRAGVLHSSIIEGRKILSWKSHKKVPNLAHYCLKSQKPAPHVPEEEKIIIIITLMIVMWCSSSSSSKTNDPRGKTSSAAKNPLFF